MFWVLGFILGYIVTLPVLGRAERLMWGSDDADFMFIFMFSIMWPLTLPLALIFILFQASQKFFGATDIAAFSWLRGVDWNRLMTRLLIGKP